MTPERIAELRQQLERMQDVSSAFYLMATQLQVHAFIEFTGFMNEYIKLCGYALEAGIDFEHINVHGGAKEGLPFPVFCAEYLGEKFGCVFAPYFQTHPNMLRSFLRRAGLEHESTASADLVEGLPREQLGRE